MNQYHQPLAFRGSTFQSGFLCLAFLILIFFTACKKDKSEDPQEPIPGSCRAVTPKGGLTAESTPGSFVYKTSGGGSIIIDGSRDITILHQDYPSFKYEFWGGMQVNGVNTFSAVHENLNGKHVKDRNGINRSIIFPDGSKITLVSADITGKTLGISIYDGNQTHHFDLTCTTLNLLDISTDQGSGSTLRDEQEADGETSTFEISPTGLKFFNIYSEPTPGNKIMKREEIGELILANPTQVNDYYDDPRLGHT